MAGYVVRDPFGYYLHQDDGPMGFSWAFTSRGAVVYDDLDTASRVADEAYERRKGQTTIVGGFRALSTESEIVKAERREVVS